MKVTQSHSLTGRFAMRTQQTRLWQPIAAAVLALATVTPVFADSNGKASPTAVSARDTVRYRTQRIDGVELFYREAGPANAPTVVLLHGFPTSSNMYRNLIPALATKYR